MANTTTLPLSVMERILKENGAERVSDSAKTKFAELVKEYCDNRAKEALQFAKHAGRKTIKELDIKAAFTRGGDK